MRILNVIVNLSLGEVAHSVPKERITELELRLLRSIHPVDGAISNITHVGELRISDRAEHLELAKKYGKKRVEDVFGVELFGFEDWLAAKIDLREGERAEREEFGYPDFNALENERKAAVAALLSGSVTNDDAVAASTPAAPALDNEDDDPPLYGEDGELLSGENVQNAEGHVATETALPTQEAAPSAPEMSLE